ncbi:MAG: single-stranded-DNA-specific exonuclease RecJ, partial [Prochlorococcus sp.]
LDQGDCQMRAIAWRWRGLVDIPERIDIAFRINVSRWQGLERMQLETLALRAHCHEVQLNRYGKTYRCVSEKPGEIILTNPNHEVIKASVSGDGEFTSNDNRAKHPYIHSLIEDSLLALGLRP